MQEEMDYTTELKQKQITAIDNKVDQLIEQKNAIMDIVAREDFSGGVFIPASLSDSEVLELLPQVKENVIDQRTLDCAYRQLLLEHVDQLTCLIESYQNLSVKIQEDNTSFTHIAGVANRRD